MSIHKLSLFPLLFHAKFCLDGVIYTNHNKLRQNLFPPFLYRVFQFPKVVRLLSDLRDYLAETDSFSDGVPLLRWFHRQFKETTMTMMEQTIDLEEIHMHMAKYFGGNWATTGKPYKDKRENNKEVLADRKVPRNPLVLQGKLIKSATEAMEDMSFVSGSNCKINLRKMNEHCFHLIKGGMLEEAANLLCNLEYIHVKVKENKLNNLLEEFSLLLNRLQTFESNSTLTKVEEFSSFVLQRGHALTLYPSLTYQEAANYTVGSSVRDCYMNMQDKPSFVLKTSTASGNKFLVSVLKGHKDCIVSACSQRVYELKQSNLLATGSLDGRIKIWFYRSGLEKGNFKGHLKGVHFIDFVDNNLLSISSDGKMALWDAEKFEERLVLSASINSDVLIPGNCCRFVSEMNWMLSAWDDGALRIGNMEGHWILIINLNQHPLTCVKMVGNDMLVAGYANGELLRYEIVNSPCDNSLKLEISHDFGINNELIEIFDVLVHCNIYVFIGKQKPIRTQYTEDSNSAWAKNRFRSDPYVEELVGEGMELSQAIGKKMARDMSSVGTFAMLITENNSCTKCVLDGLPTPHEYICGDMKFPYLVTGGSDGSIRIWEINQSSRDLSVSLVQELGSHSLEVNRIQFVSNGRQVVSVSDDMDIKLWNTELAIDKSNSCQLSQTKYRIMGCSTEGNFVVTWGERGLASAWREEELLWTKICCSGEDITSAGISPHGAKIMVGAKNYYELLNGETGSTYDVKRSCVGRRVRVFDFSKDGREALLGDNCDVRIVVVEPKMEPLGFNDTIYTAHDDHINSAQFCANLYYIATGSLDGSIKIWSSSYDCCIIVKIGLPVVSFSFNSSFNKLACIVEGDETFNIELLNEKYLQGESTILGELKTSNKTQCVSVTDESKAVMQSSVDQAWEDSIPKDGNAQVEDPDEVKETWCLPLLQDDARADEALPLSFHNDILAPNSLNGVELPPMSEEMLKNLENLQEMLMNANPITEYSPPPTPSHQIGPHRLLKKQTKVAQYEERKVFESKKTVITLLDLGRNEQEDSKIVFKDTKFGLNKCVLTEDCNMLYLSSNTGQVFVWKQMNDKWFDVGRYITGYHTFVSEVAQQSNEILIASKNIIQKLEVVSN